jgi:hypothetical protein
MGKRRHVWFFVIVVIIGVAFVGADTAVVFVLWAVLVGSNGTDTFSLFAGTIKLAGKTGNNAVRNVREEQRRDLASSA